MTTRQQSACTLTGTPTGCGYVFDIPNPRLDLCAGSETASSGRGGPDYNAFTQSTYDGTTAAKSLVAAAFFCF